MLTSRSQPVRCSQCGVAWIAEPGVCMRCWEAGTGDPLRRKIAEAWWAEPNGPRAEVAARVAHEHYEDGANEASNDARAEAERIVDNFGEACWEHGYGKACWEEGGVGEYEEPLPNNGTLVGVLAAAIEATEVHSEWGIDAALDELREALSTLRGET